MLWHRRYVAAGTCGAALLLVGSSAHALQGPAPGAASAQTLKLPDGPNSIRGLSDAASVSVFSGQVSYNVPIELPAGPAGFAPSLGLVYSGDLGNGPMGIGWHLGSISIKRSTRFGVPAYTDDDELDLEGIGSGGRLIRDPAIDGRYWVEGQGKSIRVDRVGAHFEILDSAGTRYTLGATAGGLEGGSQGTFAWHAEWIVNIADQRIRVQYTHDLNQIYLDSLAWGPNNVFGAKLEYESRPDKVISYRTGYRVVTAKRLHRIVVTSFGETLRTANLTYDNSRPVSRVATVLMTGRQGNLALPELSFGYTHPQPAAVTEMENLGGWFLNERGVTLLDVDGDGMSDLARLEMGNHQYRKNLGGRFTDPRPLPGAGDVELANASLMDLDGDARPELVHIVDDTWRFATLSEGQWHARGLWPGTLVLPLASSSSVLADINGDGRTDVIRGVAGGLLIDFNGPRGMAARRSLPRIQDDAELEPGDRNVRFTDVNGDGLADVAWLTDSWMKVFLGTGDGHFVASYFVQYPWNSAASRPVVNLEDLILADFDRDGLTDLIRFTAGHVVWYQGLAAGQFVSAGRAVPRPEAAAYDAVVTVADANGNGSQDIVWSSPRGMWVLDLAGATSAGMLETIRNGLGKTTTFTYSPSAVLSVEAELAGIPWQRLLPVSVPVPVLVSIDVGSGPPRMARYGVRDGFWDGSERRFGGFLEGHHVTVADRTDQIQYEETRFLAGLGDDRVLRGQPAQVTVKNGNGEVFTIATSSWQAVPVADLPNSALTKVAALTASSTFLYEGVTTPIEIRVTYDLDDQGRPIKETYAGRVDVTGKDEKVVSRLIADDDVTWVRGRVYDQRVEDSNGTLLARSLTYFGNRTGDALPLGQVGEGFVRRSDAFLLSENRFITQSSSQYDGCGNPTTIFANGVTRTLGYDAQCLHPTSETLTPGMGKPPLAWSMVWDNVLGVPTTLTDPNADVTHVTYDDLGRNTAVSLNSGLAHIHYAYDWTAPRPSNVTWAFDGRTSDLATSSWPNGPGWRRTTAVANGGGESLFATTPLGSQFLVSGWKERDERGHVVLAAESFFSDDPVPGARGAGARVQTMVHDAFNRMSAQTLPNGATKTMVYSALRQVVKSPDLADVTSDLDGLMRVVHTERTVNALTEFVDATYDAADRILTMTLQAGEATHEFRYDTLGRVTFASDPDTGGRTLHYDDNSFLREHINGADQHIFFDYDSAGRLIRRGETLMPSAATDYVYTYDTASAGLEAGCRVQGRLAGVVEPTGQVHLCYDVFGRSTGIGRTISPPNVTPRTSSERTEISPSGLPLACTFDDGFAVGYRYDGAGRTFCVGKPPLTAAGRCAILPPGQVGGGSDDFWVADEIDAAGRILREHYRNGISQTYGYDELGLTSKVDLFRPASGPAVDLFDLTVVRNSFGAPTSVTDGDTRGLDHSATYAYDGAGRLTDASMGRAADQYTFSYRYDGLQNMISRQISGPKEIGVLTGIYRYAERGYGPRQLTSITPGVAP